MRSCMKWKNSSMPPVGAVLGHTIYHFLKFDELNHNIQTI